MMHIQKETEASFVYSASTNGEDTAAPVGRMTVGRRSVSHLVKYASAQPTDFKRTSIKNGLL
jgi:hypothetical protein